MMRLWLASILIGSSLLTANAENPLRSDVIGKDDRQMVDSGKEPWRAIGRVANAGYRLGFWCTGTLVAPALVLTAADCLFDRFTNKPLPIKDFHFVAGMMRSDKFLAHAKAACIHKFPAFQPAKVHTGDLIRTNAAVIVLDKPLNISPLPIAEDDALTQETKVSHAGYGRDRPFALSVHHNCRVLYSEAKIAVTDCDTIPGQLGGPILVRQGDIWKLAAIMTVRTENLENGGPTSAAWRELLARSTCGQ